MLKPESKVLEDLDGVRLNGFILRLGEKKPLKRSGWTGFKLFLETGEGMRTSEPIIWGIFSRGGKDGVRPWMDIDYREELSFDRAADFSSVKKAVQTKETHAKSSRPKAFYTRGKKPLESAADRFDTNTDLFSLKKDGLDLKMFQALSALIPPGGHLMVSYEGEQAIHRETIRGLNIRIPPAATPLGFLIFSAGFQYIKNWLLSEGGFEGPRKLWGEKAPDDHWQKEFYRRTKEEIDEFLQSKPSSGRSDFLSSAKRRAEKILTSI